MNLLKKILLFLFFLNFTNVSKPISETSTKVISNGVGMVSGILAAGITYNVLTDGNLRNPNVGDVFITGAVGAATGALIGFLLYNILQQYTPKTKFANAKKIIDSLSTDNLIFQKFDSSSDFIKQINFLFVTSYPLVLGRFHYENCKNKLIFALSILNNVESEIAINNDLNYLKIKIKKLRENAKIMLEIIENNRNMIIEDPNYNYQVKLYEDYMARERQLEQQKRENALDRSQKWAIHNEKMRQKEQDRILKQNFLNRQNGPVNVNNLNINM
jgi:hypothetical protein